MLNGSLSKLEAAAFVFFFFHNIHIKCVKTFYVVAFYLPLNCRGSTLPTEVRLTKSCTLTTITLKSDKGIRTCPFGKGTANN